MRRDKIYEDLEFSEDFSVNDWNSVIKLKLRKYFRNDELFNSNEELLRTEIINYIRFSEKPEYLALFEWTYTLFTQCIEIDQDLILSELADSFDEVSNTDLKWMSNVLTQPDSSSFSERDKINYCFKVIDDILEGVFKPRFKLLCKLVDYKESRVLQDNSSIDFGNLINNFLESEKETARLFLKDPIFFISTNQWRNIAAHKSFIINKDSIEIEYGRTNIQSISIEYEKFYQILNWTQNIYRVIRLAQVLIYLNYTEQIVKILGGTNNIGIRFESSLLHLIHNMQIVGFKFVSTEESNGTFCLNFKSKPNHDLESSIIHASQCLDQLSCAIFDDEFVKDKFQKTKIILVDDQMNKMASASVKIEIALKKSESKMTLDDYIKNIDFEFNNYA